MNRTEQIAQGTTLLKAALRLFYEAGCPRTMEKVRSAMKSADGARRHAERMERQPKVRPEVPAANAKEKTK